MEIDEIRRLIELMEEKGLAELELKNRAGEIRLVRGGVAAVPATVQPPPASPPVSPPAETSSAAQEQDGFDPGLTIASPMVGTFYGAPNPDSPSFVAVGGLVETGEVVCIIEAMKMMNEIEAEIRGRVRRVLVENGQPVEYGQALFLLEPV